MAFNSGEYWKQRYNNNGNSGSGSYGRLCEFKNRVLNRLVKENNIAKVIEIGCGDGNILINSAYKEYRGYDISEKVVKICQDKIKKENYEFEVIKSDTAIEKGDLVLSLDVIFHLIEDEEYYKYMYSLFTHSTKWVIIYTSDMNEKEFNEKYGVQGSHVKSRKITEFIKNNVKNWDLVKTIHNEYPYNLNDRNNTSFSNFYIYQKKEVKENFETINYIFYYHVYKLLEIINGTGEKLEGNICTKNHQTKLEKDLVIKQKNIYHIAKRCRNILEIGFNAGFSSLLMLLSNSEIQLDCIDIGEHSYTKLCYNYINKIFPDRINLKLGDSRLMMLEIEENKHDLYHIDGGHSYEIAFKDLENCFKKARNNAYILMDDTNLKHIDDIWQNYVKSNKIKEVKEHEFNFRTDFVYYKHSVGRVNKPKTEKIIVSLTTISLRINHIEPVIKSLTEQTLKADEIRLYISKEPYLLDQGINDNSIIEKLKTIPTVKVIYTENIGSYRKLLSALQEHWNDNVILITVDDDVIYPSYVIENLYERYCENNCVVAYRGHKIRVDANKKISPYINWMSARANDEIDILNFATGKDGILYHPSFFSSSVSNSIYKEICNKGDDIWFKFCTYLMNIPVQLIHGRLNDSFKDYMIPNNKTLFSYNIKGNDEQIKDVINYLYIKF